jgi:beta-galactosidase
MKTAFFKCRAGCLLLSILITFAASGSDSAPRERLLMDFGWKFHLGNEWGAAQNLAKAGTGSGPASTWFSDASWRPVNLPHDWAIELPFDPKAESSLRTAWPGIAAHSSCRKKTPANGCGWNSTASIVTPPYS